MNKPQLSFEESDKEISIGDKVSFKCKQNTNLQTATAYHWMKGEATIMVTTSPTYVIRKVSRKDSGVYTCITKNGRFSKESVGKQLNVNRKFIYFWCGWVDVAACICNLATRA